MQDEALPLPAWRVWVRRLAPWAITTGVIAFLLTQYSLSEIETELRRGNGLAMAPVAIAAAFVSLALVAAWDTTIMRACLGRPGYTDVFRAKGATSLLSVIGYGFAHGGYGVWLARKTGADVRTTFGIILYIMLSDLAGVCLVATAAIWIARPDLPEQSRLALGTLAPAGAVGLTIVGIAGRRLIVRLTRDPRVLRPWRQVPPAIFLLNLLGRALIITVYVLATWLGADIFGLELPAAAVASYIPIIMLVAALPINVAGFGAVQVAWLLFEPWESGPRILAFQFLWHLFGMVGLLARGLPFLRGVLREIEVGPGDHEAQMVTQRS